MVHGPLLQRAWPLLLTAGVGLATCGAQTTPQAAPQPQQQTPPQEPTAAEPQDESPMPYRGPDTTVDVQKSGDGSEVVVRVTFPTGGWQLIADRQEVEGDVARVHLTYLRPARDQIVTQMLVDKDWQWQPPEPFSRVEVWVNLARRDEAQEKPDYRLAARFPATPTVP